ncbi:MAG: single-stranded-DNA-specific exonuclease RecJ [Rhodobacteraceae bacterium]|nr:single-stranded-DNA-specific exonuclease RecJ [Paracoccaceae bacterium]
MSRAAESFLGVADSLRNRRWVGPPPAQERAAAALMQSTGLPLPLCQVLAHRGVAHAEVAAFLAPDLRSLMPDPRSLRDMPRAAARLVEAVHQQQRIAIFADYDVDGGSSAALLIHWLRYVGRAATLYVPDRVAEGYGPNAPAMAGLARAHDLIVCVDCGTLGHAAIAAAVGADVIVLDHHLAGEVLPECTAIVNPNRQDESGALSYLCAAGVVFLLLVEANRQLRQEGMRGPDLLALLDLVALATVADVVPLVGLNRALVRQGLRVMARRERPGLRALVDISNVHGPVGAFHLGFVLGPRINAAGRVGRADLGARLLSTEDAAEASAIAARLDALNRERRTLQAAVLRAAQAQVQAHGQESPLVWAQGEGWHPGVLGIVAARLAEATSRPAVVMGLEGETARGSARSRPGIDLGTAVQHLAAEGLLLHGGGHRMAAGLTALRGGVAAAMARLCALLAQQGAAAESEATLLRLDGVLMSAAVSVDLIKSVETAGPFGASAPAPRFAFPECRCLFVRKIGEGHVRLRFSNGGGRAVDAVAFDAFETPMGAALLAHDGALFHLAGRLEMDQWQGGGRPQLRLEDAAPAQPPRRG